MTKPIDELAWQLFVSLVVLAILMAVDQMPGKRKRRESAVEESAPGPVVTRMSSDDFLDFYLDEMEEKDAKQRREGAHHG